MHRILPGGAALHQLHCQGCRLGDMAGMTQVPMLVVALMLMLMLMPATLRAPVAVPLIPTLLCFGVVALCNCWLPICVVDDLECFMTPHLDLVTDLVPHIPACIEPADISIDDCGIGCLQRQLCSVHVLRLLVFNSVADAYLTAVMTSTSFGKGLLRLLDLASAYSSLHMLMSSPAPQAHTHRHVSNGACSEQVAEQQQLWSSSIPFMLT
jgi:hypothetical protein